MDADEDLPITPTWLRPEDDPSLPSDFWDIPDPEGELLHEVRDERDLEKLRGWAKDTWAPVLLAVLDNPLTDDSVLDLIDTDGPFVNLALLKHPRCPPTVLERLALSRWPVVRKAVKDRLKQDAHAAQGGGSSPERQGAAHKHQRATRDQADLRTWRWHEQAYATAANLESVESDPDARREDMPDAMYEPDIVEPLFDFSEDGMKAYMDADPFDEGPHPPFLLELVAARHPRSPAFLIDRIATKLVATVQLHSPLHIDRQRRRPDGTLHELPDYLPVLVHVLKPLVLHPKLETKHLRDLAEADAFEIKALVALSPSAPLPTLKRLAASVATVASVAAHPSRKVWEVQEHLLGASEGVRAILAANRYASRWAIDSIWKEATPLELAGLAANPALSEKELRLLAGPLHGENVHVNVAANPNAPTTRLETWAYSDNARLRVAVAGNTATPSSALDDLARREREPHVLWALGRNPALPVAAMEVLVDRKQLLGLAANPNVPAALQEIIADTGDRQDRLRLARNANTVPHLLWRLVDPAPMSGHFFHPEERNRQVRIERAVSRHPHAPPEAIEYLATSTDPETWAAVQIVNL